VIGVRYGSLGPISIKIVAGQQNREAGGGGEDLSSNGFEVGGKTDLKEELKRVQDSVVGASGRKRKRKKKKKKAHHG